MKNVLQHVPQALRCRSCLRMTNIIKTIMVPYVWFEKVTHCKVRLEKGTTAFMRTNRSFVCRNICNLLLLIFYILLFSPCERQEFDFDIVWKSVYCGHLLLRMCFNVWQNQKLFVLEPKTLSRLWQCEHTTTFKYFLYMTLMFFSITFPKLEHFFRVISDATFLVFYVKKDINTLRMAFYSFTHVVQQKT